MTIPSSVELQITFNVRCCNFSFEKMKSEVTACVLEFLMEQEKILPRTHYSSDYIQLQHHHLLTKDTTIVTCTGTGSECVGN